MQIDIEPINKSFNLKNFNCGIEELNIYLSRFASVNDRKNISKTYIAFNRKNYGKVLGYYSVSMAQVIFKDIPDKLKKGLPKYPVPTVRIGKLAVDLTVQKNGLGAILLKDAFLRAVNVSSEIAVHSITVDALNDKAKSFYMKYGFIPFEEYPMTLILPIKTIQNAL